MRADRDSAAVAAASTVSALPTGRVALRDINGRRDRRCYIFRPHRIIKTLPIFVAIHGISVNARDQARLFAPLVEAVGALLVAPVFEPRYYPDYQRLGRTNLGQRADIALNDILDSVAAEVGCTHRSIALFGFSGGGQFAHRFAMANPHRVKAQVLAAPGWYTFPDEERFPYGILPSKRLANVNFDLRSLLAVDCMVAVGAKDTERDPALRTTLRVDKRQGFNRLERGRRWISEMSKKAAAENIATRFEFETLAGCAHDFEQCMQHGGLGQKTIDFLYKKTS